MSHSRVRNLIFFTLVFAAMLVPACKPIVGKFPAPPIAPPPGGLPLGVVDRGYDYDLFRNITTKGGATFALSSGTLPNGMNLAGQGIFSGVPTVIGRFNLVVDVTDLNGTVSVGLTLDILPEMSLANAALPNGFVGINYSQNMIVTGGLPAYTTTIVDLAADPLGLDITITGPGDATYEGTPGQSGIFTFEVNIIDTGNEAVLASGITVPVTIAILGAPSAYVTNAGDGSVSVIDTTTNAVTATILGVGNNPRGIALSPNGAAIYVTNFDDNTVAEIDAITNTITRTVAVGTNPLGIVAPSNGTLIYVANEADNSLTVLDMSLADPAAAAVTIGFAGVTPQARPQQLTASPDGRLIYLTLSNVFDLTDPAQIVDIPDILLVISNNPGSPDFHNILAFIDVGEGPSGVAFAPSSNLLIVASESSNEVYFIEVDESVPTFSERAVIEDITGARFVGVGAECNHAYISRTAADTVSPVDVNWDTPRTSIPAASAPMGVTFDPNGDFMYVALSGSGQVLKVDLDTGTSQTIGVGTTPTAIAAQTNPTFRIAPLLPETMERGSFNVEYRSRICTAGGTSPFTFTELDGALPPGLSLDATGLVSGTPTDASIPSDGSPPPDPTLWTFGVEVTDSSLTPLVVTESLNLKLEVCCFGGTPRLLYVANFGDDSVSAIELFGDTTVASITEGIGPNPLGVAISEDIQRAYVTNFNGGNASTVSVIDIDPTSLTYNSVVGIIGVGKGATGVIFNPTGTRAYVSNETDQTVSVIDTSIPGVIATRTVGLSPQGLATNADGSRVYVANLFGFSVTVMDAMGVTIATVPVSDGPIGVAFDAASGFLYVTQQFGSTVTYIDTASNTVAGTIDVGTFPTGIVIGNGGNRRAYVANQLEDTVSIINLDTNMEIDLDPVTLLIIDRIPVGTSPDFLTANGSRIFVTNFGSGTVSRILNLPGSDDDNTELGTISVGASPEGIKFPGGN